MPHLMPSRLAAAVVAVAALAAPVAASADSLTPFAPVAFSAAPVAGYPQQNVLPVWPDNPTDGSAAIGDIPYDEIAPQAERAAGREQPRLGPRGRQVLGRPRPLRRRS